MGESDLDATESVALLAQVCQQVGTPDSVAELLGHTSPVRAQVGTVDADHVSELLSSGKAPAKLPGVAPLRGRRYMLRRSTT